MFIALTGRGWVAGVVTGVCLLVSDQATRIYFHAPDYYSHHGWPKLAAFWLAALIVYWNLPSRPEETLGVPEREPPPAGDALFRQRDSLFFVPVRYWPLLLLAAGVGFYFVRD